MSKKEYTFISTVQLTSIGTGCDDFVPYDRDTIAKNLKAYLEECSDAFDDVQVISVQQFEMELEDEN